MPVSRSGSGRLLVALWMALLPAGGWACSVSVTGVAFGQVDPLVALPVSGTGTVSVNCPENTAYTIALSPGGGTYAARALSAGAHQLDYNLYVDASLQQVWGDGSGGSATVGGTAGAGVTSHAIHGLLPHQPGAVPGVYQDTIVVTVSY